MERRNFIKAGCSFCVAVGAGLVIGSLDSCSTSKLYSATAAENKVTVPLSLFAEGDLQIVRVRDFEYDIAVRKEADGSYTSLLMRCTHADNSVASTGKGFECYLHGSTFDKEGSVMKGPAQMPMKRLATSVSASEITVQLN